MKRHIGWIVVLVLLTGGAVLCIVRWNAWFSNPPEPTWEGKALDIRFHTFGRDTVPGFRWNGTCWEDTVTKDTLRFVVLGDVHNNVDSVQWENMAHRHTGIDFYAQLGDFMERGYWYYAQSLFQELEGTPFECLPLINCPGNHEYRKGVVRRLPDMWKTMFVHPDNGPKRFAGTTYFVDFPNLRFIVLDTNTLQKLSDYTVLCTWLKQVIDGAAGRFTVVIMHHPVYSCGVGRQNTVVYASLMHALQTADLVFAGHDHNYARRLPFVDTNSAKKFYLHQLDDDFTRVGSGVQLYELLTLVGDTLTMETYLMDGGEKYDEVQWIRHGYGRTITDLGTRQEEIINLPDKYVGKNSRKVQSFQRRRAVRLSKDSTDNIQ